MNAPGTHSAGTSTTSTPNLRSMSYSTTVTTRPHPGHCVSEWPLWRTMHPAAHARNPFAHALSNRHPIPPVAPDNFTRRWRFPGGGALSGCTFVH